MAIAHSLTFANHPSRSRQYQLQAERIYMSKLAVLKNGWEHIYTQFKNVKHDPVLCLMNKFTQKMIYYDVKQDRIQSKPESKLYRPDATGIHVISM